MRCGGAAEEEVLPRSDNGDARPKSHAPPLKRVRTYLHYSQASLIRPSCSMNPFRENTPVPGKRTATLTRTEIADAAIRIIGERGISSLTTTALANELGVSSGAPFRHFASREEILHAVGERVVELMGTTFPDESLPPLKRLSQLFESRIQAVTRHGGVARLIFSDQFSKALPEQAAGLIHAFVLRTRRYVLEALTQGAASGDIRKDVPAEHLLILFVGTMQHAAFLSAMNRNPRQAPPLDSETILRSIWTLMGSQGGAATK